MEPKDIVGIGVLLVCSHLLITLLSSIWLVPLGLFVMVVGLLLYAFEQYHDNRLRTRS